MWHSLNMSSATRGQLRTGVNATVQSLKLQGGRRFALDDWAHLTAQAWMSGTRAEAGDFTDAVGTRVSVEEVNRVAIGADGPVEVSLAEEFTVRWPWAWSGCCMARGRR